MFWLQHLGQRAFPSGVWATFASSARGGARQSVNPRGAKWQRGPFRAQAAGKPLEAKALAGGSKARSHGKPGAKGTRTVRLGRRRMGGMVGSDKRGPAVLGAIGESGVQERHKQSSRGTGNNPFRSKQAVKELARKRGAAQVTTGGATVEARKVKDTATSWEEAMRISVEPGMPPPPPNALTRLISAAPTWQDATRVWEAHGDEFNAIHLGALVQRLARLVPGLPGRSLAPHQPLLPSERARLEAVLRDSASVILRPPAAASPDAAPPRALTNILWGYVSLAHRPSAAWAGRWQAAFLATMDRARAGDLGLAVWGQARLGMTPDPTWLAAWRRHFLNCMPTARPGVLSAGLWGLTQLAPGWAKARAGHAAQDASSGASGAASMDPWLAAYLDAFQKGMPEADAQCLSTALHSLARLGVRPPEAWLNAWLAAFGATLPSAGPQALSNAAWALATLRVVPPGEWTNHWAEAFQTCLASANAQALSNSVWALARLGAPPPPGWLDAWRAAFHRRMGEASSQALSNSLWALVRLGSLPPDDWLVSWCGAFAGVMHAAGPQEVANALWALAWQPTWRPPPEWIERCAGVLAARLEAAPPHALSMALASLARLRFIPAPEWINVCVGKLDRHMPLPLPVQATPLAPDLFVDMHASGACIDQTAPPPSTTAVAGARAVSRPAPVLPVAQPDDVRQAMWALSSMGHVLPPETCKHWLEAAERGLSSRL